MRFFDTIVTGGSSYLWLGCDKRWNCAVLAMAMVRLPTTSCWCLSIDTRYSTINELKRIASLYSTIFAQKGYKIHALEVVDNHVHLFLEFHPSTSLSEVVQYLKGGSSYRLFKLHPELRTRYWGGSLWSSGKFYRSVGNVTTDTIKHYIKESQGKPKTEVQSYRLKSRQRRINEF